ncbi:hypothetical protein C0995_015100 [Termitomyces sp. Mi166|nr:hypothetical protein C0995_015100 [Termitomyces sp. Mi166\
MASISGFSLEIFDPESVSVHFEPRLGLDPGLLITHTQSSASHTRLRYARIRLVDIGVLTPSHAASPKPASSIPIPFILILEPLYLGVLPPSVVPVLAYIFIVFMIACVIVPPLIRYLEGIASQARTELSWEASFKHD